MALHYFLSVVALSNACLLTIHPIPCSEIHFPQDSVEMVNQNFLFSDFLTNISLLKFKVRNTVLASLGPKLKKKKIVKHSSRVMSFSPFGW